MRAQECFFCRHDRMCTCKRVLEGAHLDDDISVLLLRVDVGIKVRSPGLDRGLDGLQAVTPLLHVALDLPCKLDLVTDVEVDPEVVQVTHALVIEGVQALDHQDLRRVETTSPSRSSGFSDVKACARCMSRPRAGMR